MEKKKKSSGFSVVDNLILSATSDILLSPEYFTDKGKLDIEEGGNVVILMNLISLWTDSKEIEVLSSCQKLNPLLGTNNLKNLNSWDIKSIYLPAFIEFL